jgi:hypothetical protein
LLVSAGVVVAFRWNLGPGGVVAAPCGGLSKPAVAATLSMSPAPAGQVGWLRAIRDPTIAAALSLIHSDIGRPWTLSTLAGEVRVSPSTLKRDSGR